MVLTTIKKNSLKIIYLGFDYQNDLIYKLVSN